MKADTAGLRKAVENALETRMTLSFKPVSNIEEADIAVECDINEFFWTDADPVDNIAGLGAIAYDAAIKENYSRMQAVFAVKDLKEKFTKRAKDKGKPLWEENVKATITSKKMGKEESVALMNEKITKIFMRDCFSKKMSEKK